MTLMMMTVLPHMGPKLTRHRRPASTSRLPSARDSVDCVRGHASALLVRTRSCTLSPPPCLHGNRIDAAVEQGSL